VGAKTWMLVCAERRVGEVLSSGAALDRQATLQLATKLFPKEKLDPMGDGNLCYTCPPDNEIHLGCFAGVSIVAAKEFAIDYPSKLPERFVSYGSGATIYLHAMHSVVDWFAFACWDRGKLVRSLSVSPESGVLEDLGQRLPFEEPYWSGRHPVGDDEEEEEYPLPFHPLELGEAALNEFFGYQLEGSLDAVVRRPESIPLVKYARSRSWWKVW